MSFFKSLKGFAIFIVLLLAGYGKQSFAQCITPSTNSVRVRIPQIPVIDTSKLDTIPIQRQAVSIQYSDGLGRPLQRIQVQGSATLKDLIVPYAYDNMGRTVKAYLPYADQFTGTSTKGTFRCDAILQDVNFYNPANPGAPRTPTDIAPFSQTVYEASPLGRTIEQGGIGSNFQPGTGHTRLASHQVNSYTDGIYYYNNVVEGSLISTNTFTPGTLTKTVVTDQNGHRLAAWKDLQGRTVTRTQLDAPNQYYSTDYIYNDLGQLSAIVPPAAKKQYHGVDVLKSFYIFHYDSIGRVVEKKVPGKGWVYTVYNHGDQPVLSQDSNMRAKNQWIFMKYDAQGRIVQTGIYINKTTTSRKALQYLCDNSYPVLWETWQPGTGYTNNAFPQQSAVPGSSPLAIHTTFYYDDYSFTEASGKPFQTNVYNTVPSLRTMGKLTGISVYVLGTANQRLVTVNYYDNKNRLIQQQGDNHLGQVDVVNNQYNFIGELISSQRTLIPIAGSPITIKDRYVHDHMSRLMDTYESFQGQPEIDISHNVWNELGQKVSEGLHYIGNAVPNAQPGHYVANITENTTITTTKTDIASQSVTLNPGFSATSTASTTYLADIGTTFAQTQEFRYSIRGEVTSINNGTLTYDNGVTQSDSSALFGESITYSEPSPLTGATPQYNGNISGFTWRNKIEQSGLPGLTTGGQGYTLNYDQVNRLTQSNYYNQTGSTFTKNTSGALTEKITAYDEMGNIDTLQRRDKAGNLLNSLAYTYQANGNQLTSISDVGSQHINGTFTYDGNGNMTSDSRKGITITYNYMDLPDTVKQGGNRLVFTYDATGNKLYKQLISSSGTVLSQRHYVEDLELTATSSVAVDGKVESIAMDEGRIVYTGATGGYQYEYYLQDHLYTNRVSFQANADGTPNLTSVQNYYPFGGNMGDATMNFAGSLQNQYKYEGKELQPELNLNTYDFGARHYDPVLGRWTAIDPLAEQSEGLSPYNYVENNPMNLMDLDGMQVENGYQFGFHIGGGASGGSFGSAGDLGGAGLNALTQGITAGKAFSWHVTTQNWGNNSSKVQGNGNGYWKTFAEESKNYDPATEITQQWNAWIDKPETILQDLLIKPYISAIQVFTTDYWVNLYKGQVYYWSSPSDVKAKLDARDFHNMLVGFGSTGPIAEYGGAFTRSISGGIDIARVSELEVAKNGETAATARGRAMHNAYKAGLADNINTFKEFNDIKGIRPDFVDFNTRTIYELKPKNYRAMKMGEKQLKRYKEIFEETYSGTWTTVLDTY